MSLRTIIFSLSFLFLVSCANDTKKADVPVNPNPPSLTNPANNPPSTQTITPNTPPAPEPAQNAEGVWHYTCANGCEGGSGTAEACKGCGSPLAHNQAYHSTTTDPNIDASTIAPPPVEAPQNPDGVWHFTCSKGCEGGSGTAEACKGCGATLVHNQAYHN